VALDFLERFGLIENEGEFVRGERFKSQQIAKTIGSNLHSIAREEEHASF